MVCKYYKIRKKDNKKERRIYYFCNKQRKEIHYSKCKNCSYREEKEKKILKQRTSKQNKKEKERFSILCKQDRCVICDNPYNLTWHEVFRGRNRANSMQYGLCLRLCLNCHKTWQENVLFNEYWHKVAQTKFNEIYPDLDFLKIFGRNY